VQRFKQGQIIEFGVMTQGDDAGAQIHREVAHHIIRHADDALHAAYRPGLDVFGTRVAHRHLEPVE